MNITESSDIYKDRILILDFGSQYTELIARRVRRLGVYCEVFVFWNITEVFIRNFYPSGIILSGSPISADVFNEEDITHCVLKYIFQSDIPILGICYGMHIMVLYFGGEVQKNLSKREFGYVQLEVISDNLLIRGIYDDISDGGVPILNVWMSHADSVVSVPKDFVIVGVTKNQCIAIIAHQKKHVYGVQFHPEVTHTIQGDRILERFILEICSCKLLWKMSNISNHLVSCIRKIVGDNTVMLAFSGGIDSLVTALLLQRAVSSGKLFCYFIDSGLLRYNDKYYVKKFIHDYSLDIFFISVPDRFFDALVGVIDPEDKRKVIGRVFIEVFEEQKKYLTNDVKWLAQGTIYSDIIESGVFHSFKNAYIKSHHNVGGLPDNIETMQLLEPIKYLFKDEVRQLGKELGIPVDILYRHPFPGPGFGIRILGEVKEEYCTLLRQADYIFIEELRKHDLYTKVSQAFVVFLPVKSVGIMGDVRKYEWVIALRAVETVDFMTARWARLPCDFLCAVSSRIMNEVHGISRVVYDISNKPPSTIEWE